MIPELVAELPLEMQLRNARRVVFNPSVRGGPMVDLVNMSLRLAVKSDKEDEKEAEIRADYNKLREQMLADAQPALSGTEK